MLTGEVEVAVNPTRYDYAFWGNVNELTFTGLATDETKENLANTVYDQ